MTMFRHSSTWFIDALLGLQSLVFPSSCIICSRSSEKICKQCNAQWISRPRFTKFVDVPTASVVPYSSEVSSVVLKAKEDGNRVARRLIAEALYKAVDLISTENKYQPFVLVPIPSSRQAIRKRGESFLHPILNHVNEIAAAHSRNWIWRELLIHKKRVRDQAGLNFRERSQNLKGVFEVREDVVEKRPIILIDDVITTGSTLKNAILALNERKMTVFGAATACASAHQFLIR
jgi:ComF family protein